MAIIDDHEAIARRLRELKPSSTPTAKDTDLDKWRDLAEQTARVYVQNRRRGPMADSIYQKAQGGGDAAIVIPDGPARPFGSELV